MDIDTMFFVVVNRGKANAILRKTQEYGATGGTILLGEGTAPSKLLEVMGINGDPKGNSYDPLLQ